MYYYPIYRDGDKVINRSVYSNEAIEEIDKYNDSLLSIMSLAGNNQMTIAREGAQALYDLTNANPKDLLPENKKLNTYINEFFTPNRKFKLSEIVDLIQKFSIYTKVRYKGVNTTLGRIIFNEVVFNHIKDHKFINETLTSGRVRSLLNEYGKNYVLTGKITVQDYKDILDKHHDLAFGICELVSSPVTYNMLIKDDPTFNKKREELMDKYKIDENVDPVVMAKFEKEMIDFSKEYYKDDPMYNLYESGAAPKWDNDFKLLKVSVGATTIPGSSKKNIVVNNLKDGLKTADILKTANSQITAGIARGIDTEEGGYLVKKFNAAFQSVFVSRGDCKSKEYLTTVDNSPQDLLGRTILDNGKEVLVTHENINKYLGKPVKKRSPIFCKQTNGYCSTCAGILPLQIANKDRLNIGLYLAEIGNEVMNKSMKAVHQANQKFYHINDFDDFIAGEDD